MNRKSWLTVGIVAALFAANLSLGACASIGGEQPAVLQQKIVNARTKTDHENLAGHYEQEANVLQAKAKEHEQMARSYGWSDYAGANADFVRHCNLLAGKYRSAAEDNLALARTHQELAAKAQQ